ncbi:MAG: hypothetical protein E7626_07040 [Ruminococcaceae bacterium]|nr:hypothetical protein [Oscillospiraceae bacterium]
MKNLIILVKMQVKEQMNFKRMELDGISPFKIFLSVLVALLKFAFVAALCFAFLWVSNYLQLFSFTSRIPTEVISIVFSVMLAASVISCTVGLTRSLYFASDNAVLLTFPCKPIQVYLSKLIIFFVNELRRSFTFIVPLFVAYFIINKYNVGAYFWMILCILLIALMTVGIGALLSIPAMYISGIFRRRRSLQALTLFVLVGSVTLAVFKAISLIPEDIDLIATWGTTYWQIQDVLSAYANKFSVLHNVAMMILGETRNAAIIFPIGATAVRTLAVLGVSVLCFGISLLIVRPLFYKMASKPFEHMKRRVRPHRNHVLPRRVSAIWAETLGAMKSANRIFFNFAILIAVPLLIFLQTKIFLAMKTRDMGNYMVVAFNVLIILLVLLNANTYAASVFSRDGRSSYLIKTQPAKYSMLLNAKLIPNTVFGILSLAATFVILYTTSSVGGLNTTLLMFGIAFIYIAHLIFCAELDIMNPQNELYASMGSSENNPNESKATASAFIIAFLVAAIVFLLMLEKFSTAVFVKIFLIGLGALIWRAYLFNSKIRVYYKEK